MFFFKDNVFPQKNHNAHMADGQTRLPWLKMAVTVVLTLTVTVSDNENKVDFISSQTALI